MATSAVGITPGCRRSSASAIMRLASPIHLKRLWFFSCIPIAVQQLPGNAGSGPNSNQSKPLAPAPTSATAFFSSATVISTGTIFPATMYLPERERERE